MNAGRVDSVMHWGIIRWELAILRGAYAWEE